MTRRHIALAAGLAVLAAVTAASVHAFPITRYNDLTFSRAFALPGMTLPAGEYRFEVVNMSTGANVVRVSHRATSRVHFTGHTRRVLRPHALPDGPLVTFGEAAAGTPLPVRIWYPRGGGDGHAFVY